MLSISPIKSSSSAAHYFGSDDYYLADGMQPSAWCGKGAEALGLSGPVNGEVFKKILDGKLPNGDRLGRINKQGDREHKPGWDLTFSAPKSVSVAAEVCGDKRLIEAHDEAVKVALSHLEKKAAITRVKGSGGEVTKEYTGNLTIATFRHDTSRALDPQLHTHAVVMNATQRKDGNWRSVESRDLCRLQKEAGAIYRSELAARAKELGYTPIKTHADCRFELQEIPKEIQEHFSKRSEAIEKVLEARGKDRETASGREKEVIALKTRDRKQDVNRESLQATWEMEARALGLGHSQEIEPSSDAKADLHQEKENEKAKTAKPQSEVEDISVESRSEPRQTDNLRGDWIREANGLEFGAHGVTKQAENQTVDSNKARQEGLREAIKVVKRVVAHLSERESSFRKEDLEKEVREGVFGKARKEDVDKAICHLKEDGQLIDRQVPHRWDNNKSVDGFTTPKGIETEKNVLSYLDKGQGATPQIMPKETASSFVALVENAGKKEGYSWNDQQREATIGLLTSKNRIAAIQGAAGTAKTSTVLRSLAKAAGLRGYHVYGMAPSASAARQLEEGAGIRSQTIQSFLNELARKERDSIRGNSGESKSEGGNVWVIDEASLIGARLMEKIGKAAERHGAKVILSGDRQQLGSVEAGQPFAQMQKNGMETFVLDTILRQKNQKLLSAVEDAYRDKAGEAISKIKDMGGIIEIPNPGQTDIKKGDSEAGSKDRSDAIVKDFLSLSQSDREKTIIITPGKEDRELVNLSIRSGLKEEGLISKKDIEITTLDNKGLTRAESKSLSSYKIGDVVKFSRDYERHNISKQNLYSVTKIDQNANLIYIQSGESIVKWNPEKLSSRSEAYSVTNRSLSSGDKIVWNRNDRVNGFKNGDILKIHSIDSSGKAKLIPENGKVREINLKENRFFNYAYARTTYNSQGATAERALIHAESHRANLTTQRAAYVGISRAKMDVKIYTDSTLKLMKAVNLRFGEKTSSLDEQSLGSERGWHNQQNTNATSSRDWHQVPPGEKHTPKDREAETHIRH